MIPNTTSPIATPVMTPVVPNDAPHDDVPVHGHQEPALSGPDKPGGALAHLPPSHDLHSQVQGAAYAAPHGAGGAGGAPATPDPRKAMEVSPEERESLWEKLYNNRGFGMWQGNFRDILVDREANALVSDFVARRPTIKVLALAFLILIGVMLVAEGLGQHIDKGYIYFAMAFAVGIEMINLRVRKKPAAPAADETGEGPMPDFDDPRVERAMMELERDMEHLDENNPRHMAHMMRKMKARSVPDLVRMVAKLDLDGPSVIDMGTSLERNRFAASAPRLEASRGEEEIVWKNFRSTSASVRWNASSAAPAMHAAELLAASNDMLSR